MRIAAQAKCVLICYGFFSCIAYTARILRPLISALNNRAQYFSFLLINKKCRIITVYNTNELLTTFRTHPT